MRSVAAAIFGRTESALAVAILLAAAIFSVASPYFLTLSNAVDLVEAYSVTTIFAAGVFVVLVSGGIDISFAATASAAQYLAAYVATRYGFPALPSIALACLLGIVLGSMNGLLTYYLRVASIIVTIATSSIYYALLIYFTDGTEIYNLPDWWSDRSHRSSAMKPIRETLSVSRFPSSSWSSVVLATRLLMGRMRIGRQIYALGGNPGGGEPDWHQRPRRPALRLWLSRISGRASPASCRRIASTRRFRPPWSGRSSTSSPSPSSAAPPFRGRRLDGRRRARGAAPRHAAEWA